MGLLVPLVVLYLLKVRRERKVVPSVWLWQAAERDLQASKPFRKFTPSVPLVLEIAALVALSLAFAGPLRRSGRVEGARLVLVVDVSASMGAVEGGVTRIARAKIAALELLRRLAPGAELMLLAAGREAELVSPFERDRRRLEAALSRLSADEVEGQLGPAMAMAADQLRQRGGGRIVLVTDGAVADADTLVTPGGVPVEVVRVPAGSDNTALVRAEVARRIDPVTQREQVQVFALVVHDSKQPRDVFVTLTQRNVVEPLASRRLRLEPGERSPVVLAFDAAPGDVGSGVSVELSPPDALVSDDRVSVRVPLGRKLPVVVAPKAASAWLVRALGADPEVELFRTELAGLTAGSVPEDALVVVDGACPERLPGADLLIVNPGEGACRTATVGQRVDRPRVTSWSDTDPRMRFLTFDGVEVSRARELRPARAGDALVHTQGGALIADISSPGRSGTLIAFDVGESSWPLKASFVLFMRNVVERARAHRAGMSSAPARTGEPISLKVPFDAPSVSVEGANREREDVPVRSGLAVIPPPTRVGFLHTSWKGRQPGSVLIPVNLASEVESRIAPRTLPYGAGSKAAASAVDQVASLDWILALVALGFLLLDVAWSTRAPRARAGAEAARAAPAQRSRLSGVGP